MRLFIISLLGVAVTACTQIPVKRTYSIEVERDGTRFVGGLTLEPPQKGFRK